MCRNHERLPGEGPLGQLKYAKQGNVIAAKLIAARVRVVIGGVNRCVPHHGWLVLDCRYAIPTASVREAHEKRKHPQPQHAGREKFAMAL